MAPVLLELLLLELLLLELLLLELLLPELLLPELLLELLLSMSTPRSCEHSSSLVTLLPWSHFFGRQGPASVELSVSDLPATHTLQLPALQLPALQLQALRLACAAQMAQLGTAPCMRAPASNRGHQVIGAFSGRTVVLTIGRLVASNPSFASVRAPAHRHPPRRQQDACTIPLPLAYRGLSKNPSALWAYAHIRVLTATHRRRPATSR